MDTIETLAIAPLGKLGVQRRYGALSSRRQQMPVRLVSNVDIPVPKEVGKLSDLNPPRKHRGRVGVP